MPISFKAVASKIRRRLSLKFFILLWLLVILTFSFFNLYNYNDTKVNFVTPFSNLLIDDNEINLFQSYDIVNSTVYGNLFQNNYLYQFLVNFDFDQRCDIYFNEAYHMKNHPDDLIVNPHQSFDFDSNYFKTVEQFIKVDLENLKNDRKQRLIDEKFNEEVEKLKDAKVLEMTQEIKGKMFKDMVEEIRKEQKLKEEEELKGDEKVEGAKDDEKADEEEEINEGIQKFKRSKNDFSNSKRKNVATPDIFSLEKYKELINFIPEIDRNTIEVDTSEINIEIDDSEIEFNKEVDTQNSIKKYEDFWVKILEDEQSLHNYITHTKIFNKCFLSNQNQKSSNSQFIKNQQKVLKKLDELTPLEPPVEKLYGNCRTLEKQIYPWLSQKFPIYHQISSGKTKNMVLNKNDCFLSSLNDQLSGRGLVLTTSDDYIHLFIRLLYTLDYLGNTLSIELMHRNDLSQENLEKVARATRETGQDVWLVDMTPALDQNYQGEFQGYGNKIIASLFNTFSESMLIDADTVLLKAPQDFFKMKKYVSSGTLFFKDRTTPENRSKGDIKFFKKLFNSQLDEIAFNLPRVTSHTLEKPFFTELQNHFMESGVVLSNRIKHFHQPLIMALLSFYSPITNRIYGDKEMFWLSLAFYGDENYEFNDNFAAAIGEITPMSDRYDKDVSDRGFKSQEICSNHPAHISDEDNHTLLWFNSGFKFCGQGHKVDFKNEFSEKKRYKLIKTLKNFKAFFEDKLKIRQAIIPPTLLRADNDLGEPGVGWYNMREYCAGYCWCAYSSMALGDPAKGEVGEIIEFTKKEQREFDAIGDIWIRDY